MEINNKRVHESQTWITRTLEFPSVLWGLGFILSLGIGVGGTPLFVDITKHPVIGGLGLGEVLSYKGGNRLLLSTPKLNAPSCPSTETCVEVHLDEMDSYLNVSRGEGKTAEKTKKA